MKKFIFAALCVLSALSAVGQVTPHIGLQLPADDSLNWGTALNSNSSLLDSLLSGTAPLPGLSVSGPAIFPQLQTWQVGTSYSTGQVVAYLGTFYASVGSSNQGNLPTNATFWSTSFGGSTGGLLAANNLSDLTNTTTARSNLGLGTAATQATAAFDAAGAATAAQAAAEAFSANAANLSSGTVPVARVPVATSSALGAVRPDNTTCTVTSGVLTCPGSGGSGVTQVSTLPGTCTAGVQYQLPSGYVATCGPTNTFVNNTGVSLDPRQFGADFNGAFVADASTTSGSNVVTCPNSDCHFPSGISGYIIFATAGSGTSCLDNPSITFGSNLQTTVSGYTNANSITVAGNSNTTATGTACLAWFPKDSTTALTNWWTAGGCTGVYQMPPGNTLFSAPIMQNLSGCPGSVNTGTAYQGQTVHGAGVGSTYLIPAPIFTYTSIIGTQATNCAVGNLNIEHLDHFAVYGLGERATTTINGCLIMIGQATSAFRIDGVGWDARGGGTTLYGVYMLGIEDTFNVGGTNYFGSVGIAAMNNQQDIEGNYFSGNAASVNGVGGFITGASGAGGSIVLVNDTFQAAATISAGTVVNANNVQFAGASGDAYVLYMNGGKMFSYGNTFINGATDFSSTGSILSARDSDFAGNITGAAGNTLADNCGNTFGGTTTLNGMANYNNCPGEHPGGGTVTTNTCTNYIGTGTTVTCTWSGSPAAGQFVAVGVTAFGTASAMTATDSAGNTYTPVAAIYTPVDISGTSTRLFYFGPLAASITTLTANVTMSGGAGLVVNANSVTGIATSSQLDGSQCAGDINTAGTLSCGTAITTTVASDLIFCNAVSNAATLGFTPGTGFTAGSSFNFDNVAQFKTQTAIGAFTPTIILANGGGGANAGSMLCAAFKP